MMFCWLSWTQTRNRFLGTIMNSDHHIWIPSWSFHIFIERSHWLAIGTGKGVVLSVCCQRISGLVSRSQCDPPFWSIDRWWFVRSVWWCHLFAASKRAVIQAKLTALVIQWPRSSQSIRKPHWTPTSHHGKTRLTYTAVGFHTHMDIPQKCVKAPRMFLSFLTDLAPRMQCMRPCLSGTTSCIWAVSWNPSILMNFFRQRGSCPRLWHWHPKTQRGNLINCSAGGARCYAMYVPF